MGSAVRPAKDISGPPMGCVWRRPRFRGKSAGGAQGDGGSDAAQGGDGNLVCLLLWHAVAGHRTALRYPFQNALRTVRPWARLGLWRRLLDRLRRTWRRACGDAPGPSAVVIDCRSCRSAPSCFARYIDSGKKIHGVKIQMAVEKYGIPLDGAVSG
jgi:hypothetical protein